MTNQTRDGEGGWRGPESDDAESTHYRPMVRDVADHIGRDDSSDRNFYSNVVSIRMHSQAVSWGLAAKIAAPIILVMLASLVIIAYIIQGKVAELQTSDIKTKAYPIVRTIGKYGRVLISWRDRFMREHPEYDTATEWRVDEHWLVKGGFIGVGKGSILVGSPPDAVVPVERLENAEARAELLNLADWDGEMPGDTAEREMVAAFVLDQSGHMVAASVDMTSGQPATEPSLWRLPPEPAADGAPAAKPDESAPARIDYLADWGHGPLMRVVVPITRNAVNPETIGVAIGLFRTDRIYYERRDFMIVIVALVVGLLLFMSAVCWFAARRVTVPLRRLTADLHAIADGDLSRRSAISGTDEIGMLAQAFNSMAERLRVARMNAQEANRLDSDLAVARSIQNSLLPPQTPRIRGLDIHTSYRPAKEIGGDYYDFLPVDSHHMGLVVADASGKSIPAALVMSTTRAILRFVAPGSVSAAGTLTRANAILSVDIPRGMFVTAYYIILDPLNNAMTCASAGHNPLLLGRADGSVELINPGGIALGFDQGPIFQRSIKEQTVKLASGDRVLMYTDGVVECANIENEEYSDRRLREFLRRHRSLPSSDFVGALLADLDRHRGGADIRDDTTIVTFKVL